MSGSSSGSARAFVLVGPTASGKTEVAHILAARTGWPILSADSMLVYRGMDVGTAKPSAEDLRRFGYAGVDLFRPDETGSAGEYVRRVRTAIAASGAGAWIVCGGTGFYLRCLFCGLDPLPAADAAVRREAEQALRAGGVEALQRRLEEASPGALARLADPRNPRRLARALEIARGGGQRGDRPALASVGVMAGLRLPAALLQRRIEARVRDLFAGQLLEEARRLTRQDGPLSETARHAIGYEEAFAVADGRCRPAEAVARTVLRTRQYAKRQMTWFRHQTRVVWIDRAEETPPSELADRVQAVWNAHGPIPFHF